MLREIEPKIKDRTKKDYLQYSFNLTKDMKMLPDDLNSLPLMTRLANEDQIIQLGGKKVEINEEERIIRMEELNQLINIPKYAESLNSALKTITLSDLPRT